MLKIFIKIVFIKLGSEGGTYTLQSAGTGMWRHASSSGWDIKIYYISQVTDSIYDLVGAEIHPKVKSHNVEKVFTSMDLNKDGVISLEEFVDFCNSSNRVTGSLAVLP